MNDRVKCFIIYKKNIEISFNTPFKANLMNVGLVYDKIGCIVIISHDDEIEIARAGGTYKKNSVA